MKITIVFWVSLITLTIVAGCTSTPVVGTVIPCSDYLQITDAYKTPGPVYHIIYSLNGENNHAIISEAKYQIFYSHIGKFIYPPSFLETNSGNYRYINLTHLNESETGYRDACMVMP